MAERFSTRVGREVHTGEENPTDEENQRRVGKKDEAAYSRL
jgi:hypothetical protein